MNKIVPTVLFVLLVCSFVFAANCPPSLPKTYVGNVYFNDTLLTGEFGIWAKIGNDVVGSSDLLAGGYSIDVSPCAGVTSDVDFFINGIQANEKGSYSGMEDWGKEIGLDLTLNTMPVEGELCGNEVVDPGEACDGTNLAGRSTDDCGTGWTGTISCNEFCQIDYSNCVAATVCGDGVCHAGEDCNSCEADCGACQTNGGGGGSSSSEEGIIHIVSLIQVTNGITKELGNQDSIEFKILNLEGVSEDHTISTNYIGEDSVSLTIQSDPITIVLERGQVEKINLIPDNFYDLYIKLERIVDGKAKITIKSIYEEMPAPESEPEILEGGEGNETERRGITGAAITGFVTSGRGVASIIGLIVIIVLIVLVFRPEKKKKK